MNQLASLLAFVAGALLGIIVGANGLYLAPNAFSSLLLPLSATTQRKQQTVKVSEETYFCPSQSVILANIKQLGNWRNQGLEWSFDHRVWQPKTALRFERALFKRDTNALTCYYVWPNPQRKKTKRWLTLSLNLAYNQAIKPIGKQWTRANGLNSLMQDAGSRHYKACNSTLEKSCAFKLEHKAR
jgi:hypothetical protein